MRKLIVGFILFATACSQGVPAPPIGTSSTICTGVFCIDVPSGWQVQESGTPLLEDAGVGSYTRSQRMVGGAVRSWGDHETGPMWRLVYPLTGSAAIGVELRAPNDSWEPHPDVVFDSVTPHFLNIGNAGPWASSGAS